MKKTSRTDDHPKRTTIIIGERISFESLIAFCTCPDPDPDIFLPVLQQNVNQRVVCFLLYSSINRSFLTHCFVDSLTMTMTAYCYSWTLDKLWIGIVSLCLASLPFASPPTLSLCWLARLFVCLLLHTLNRNRTPNLSMYKAKFVFCKQRQFG